MIFSNLVRKYKTLTLPIKASFWFILSNLFQKGIQFFTVPILTRIMPAYAYGKYSVFLSWYQIISIFATLNMWNYVINNGMIKYEKKRDEYISSLQGLSTVITIVLFLIYTVFSDTWEKYTSLTFTSMAIMFTELLLMPSYEYWCAKERFEYKYRGVVIISVAVTALTPIVSIPLVMLCKDKGMAAITGRTLTSATLFLIPAIIIAVKGKKFYCKEYWQFALKFNLPLIPHFLSIIVLQQSDRIMIAAMSGADKAGIYSVAYSAAMVLQIVNSAVLSSYVPYTYNAIRNNKFEDIKRSSSILLAFISFLNLLLIFIAPETITLLGPDEYREAMYIIPPVAISSIFMFMFNLFANIEYYFEETKFVAIASIGSAIINIILNYICIPKFGYIAAGYTTLICYILYSLGHYIFMLIVSKKHIDGYKIYNIKHIIAISLISVVLSFVIMQLYCCIIIRYIVTIFLLIVVALIYKKHLKLLINNKN